MNQTKHSTDVQFLWTRFMHMSINVKVNTPDCTYTFCLSSININVLSMEWVISGTEIKAWGSHKQCLQC